MQLFQQGCLFTNDQKDPAHLKIMLHYWGKQRAYWGKCPSSYIVKKCPGSKRRSSPCIFSGIVGSVSIRSTFKHNIVLCLFQHGTEEHMKVISPCFLHEYVSL